MKIAHEELKGLVGKPVQVIFKSSLNCNENEQPIYHSGILNEVLFEDEFEKGAIPTSVVIEFFEDSLYRNGETEIVSIKDFEDIFLKRFDVFGYGSINSGITLSVKGEDLNKIIWLSYKKGRIIPEYISDGSISHRKKVSEADRTIINEVLKYGAAQSFIHFVLSNSDPLEKFPLTEENKRLFYRVYNKHQLSMGTDMKTKYSLSNIENVYWSSRNDCLIVQFINGDWWHYTKDHTWY